MYYVGYHPELKEGGMPVHQIGLVESDDAGRTWRRLSSNPVVPRGPKGSYDAFSTSSASVLRVGREWWLWYGGIAQVPYLAGICLARSADGVGAGCDRAERCGGASVRGQGLRAFGRLPDRGGEL
jgi:hypothetical protein